MPVSLREIVANKVSELEARKNAAPFRTLEARVKASQRRLEKALSGDGVKVIAEIKLASPSTGELRGDLDLEGVLSAYNRYAAGISVLGDRKFFKGGLELVESVVKKTELPVLCKDFIIDVYQIYEARALGADAALLIVKILDEKRLRELFFAAQELGMTAVVEVQNESEIAIASKLSGGLLLINNRDLETFEIDLATTERLAPLAASHALVVSASGINSRKDIDSLLPVCSRFLIGSALMRSDNIEAKLKELVGA